MLSADACLIVTVVVKTVLSEDYKHVQPYKQFTWCQFCYAVHIHSCVLLESVLCNSWTFGTDNAVHLKKKKIYYLNRKEFQLFFFSMKQADVKKTNNFVGDQLQMTHLMDSTKHTEEFSALSECLLLICNWLCSHWVPFSLVNNAPAEVTAVSSKALWYGLIFVM